MGAGANLTTAMNDAAKVLGQMNRNISLPGLQRIAMDFERESDLMEQRQELMDDAMDEATGMDEEDEAEDEILDKVLEEIGVDLKHSVSYAKIISNGSWLKTFRWEKHLKDFKERPLLRVRLRKLSVVGILEMMTYKPD